MRQFANPLLSLSAPLLIMLAILGISQRRETDRLQALPALIVGGGLVVSSALSRRRRRKRLLMAIRKKDGVIK